MTALRKKTPDFIPTPSRRARRGAGAPGEPCIGLEAEFTLYVDDQRQRPEDVFGNPRHLVREKMIPRQGRSWHLPSGGALYFDTGVIEVATPIIELGPDCAVRAARSLWEQIAFVRAELDAWESKHGAVVRLEGFSTHYNVSLAASAAFDPGRAARLAKLLTYLLPAPVMLLAANRQSTGVGVRPRPGRIEVTADFTPDPDLMTANAALIAGVIPEVAQWPNHQLPELTRRRLPVIAGFRPCKHTSRKGYLARFNCFPANPFACDVGEACWPLEDGRRLSLREIAQENTRPFSASIRAVADEAAHEHIFAILDGRARSLLDFPERPALYHDVGRVIDWQRRTHRQLPRSRYEKVIQRLTTHRPIRVGSATYRPERMLGWYEVAFRNTKTGRRRVFNLDDLVAHGVEPGPAVRRKAPPRSKAR